ncbi:uncharacterized protein LOC135939180 [Cloeon dipterum]|uniref:uncharacterized protein LOC135939180 n=1 Tax=Cloeon dipterum TaxID=197152 RepID=UPI00321F8305
MFGSKAIVAVALIFLSQQIDCLRNNARQPQALPNFPQACPERFTCQKGVLLYRCYCESLKKDLYCSQSLGEIVQCPKEVQNGETPAVKNDTSADTKAEANREGKIQFGGNGGNGGNNNQNQASRPGYFAGGAEGGHGHFNPNPEFNPVGSFGNNNYQDNFNQRPTTRTTTTRTTRYPDRNNGESGSSNRFKAPQEKCSKPIVLVVLLIFVAVIAAALIVALVVVVRKYKQALHQIIHMNELYSSVGLEKKNTNTLGKLAK